MSTYIVGGLAGKLLTETPTASAIDPVFMTGVVAICAIVVFSLTITVLVIFGNNESMVRAALKALVELWRAVWS